MSTEVLIAIVIVGVIVVVGLVVVLPQVREGARRRQRERELEQRRRQASAEHLEEAEVRDQRAEAAEHRARIAAQEAQRERAEAQLHEERAAAHEQGLADHELVQEHERERFGGDSAGPAAPVSERSERDAPMDPRRGPGEETQPPSGPRGWGERRSSRDP